MQYFRVGVSDSSGRCHCLEGGGSLGFGIAYRPLGFRQRLKLGLLVIIKTV